MNDKGIILREATLFDLDTLVDMENQCFTDPWSKDMLKSEIENKLTTVFIMEDADKIVGYASLWVIFDEANINNIAIMPFARGQGYGQWLIIKIIEAAKEQKVKHIMLEVRASNTKAKRLYEKNGFVYIGQRIKYYEDGEDADIMCLSDL